MAKAQKTNGTAKKAKASRKPTKGESLQEITELLTSIEKKEEEVELAELELESKREETKATRGVWLTRVNELRELVRARKRWAEEAKQQPLLTGKPLKADTPQPSGSETGGPLDGSTVMFPESKDAWKAYSTDSLTLQAKTLAALQEAGLTTLGKLSDHIRDQGDWWAREIKGVGEKAAEEIADAFAAFWKEHPEFCEA